MERVVAVFGAERVMFAAAPLADVAPHTDLLARFEEELKLHGYSPRTRKAYGNHVRRCLMQITPPGDVIGLEHLRA